MSLLYQLLPWLLPAVQPGDLQQSVEQCRWLIVDCESSGLDPRKDRLLEVGGVAVNGKLISLAESFEGLLRQEVPSSIANILIHGISGKRQLAGASPGDVMQMVAAALQGRIVVGFHAQFDRELCRRALHRFALRHLKGSWLDLADLAPALMPQLAGRCRTLDDWLAALNIGVVSRHTAAADAMAAAQLLQRLLSLVPPQTPVKVLFDAARVRRALALQRSPYL